MTTAAFSSDGSVLAVAADKVITLWDPDRNTLLAVIGDSLEVTFLIVKASLHTSWMCPRDACLLLTSSFHDPLSSCSCYYCALVVFYP